MFCAVTYATFHHFSVLVFGVPLPSEPFTCRTLTISFAFAGHKSKNGFGEPETFSTFLSGISLPTSLGRAFEGTPEAANGPPGQAAPVALGVAVLVVDVLVGFLLGHSLNARHSHRLIHVSIVG